MPDHQQHHPTDGQQLTRHWKVRHIQQVYKPQYKPVIGMIGNGGWEGLTSGGSGLCKRAIFNITIPHWMERMQFSQSTNSEQKEQHRELCTYPYNQPAGCWKPRTILWKIGFPFSIGSWMNFEMARWNSWNWCFQNWVAVGREQAGARIEIQKFVPST